MRRGFLLAAALLILCLGASARVAIDGTNFPDAAFRACVREEFDADGDGALSDAEIARAEYVVVGGKGVSSLKGLALLPNVKDLLCEDNALTELDLSANKKLMSVNAGGNKLTRLDVSMLGRLDSLKVADNQLARLDVGALADLIYLDVSGNPLTGLDVSNNRKLDELYCARCGLAALDVSANHKLRRLSCGQNGIERLDLTGAPNLTLLECAGNGMKQLTLSGRKMTHLYVMDNALTGLDIERYHTLEVVNVTGNRLTEMDLSRDKRLYSLRAGDNAFTNLDVSRLGKLRGDMCSFDGCEATVHPDLAGRVDLTALPGKFRPERASDWQGGTVSGGVLIPSAERVTYTYDIGRGHSARFALVIGERRDPGAGGAAIEIVTPRGDNLYPAPGAPVRLQAVLDEAHAGEIVSWKARPAKTAEIDGSGLLTFKKPGTVTVTASVGREKATVKLVGYDPGKTYSLGLNADGKLTMRLGAIESLRALVFPEDSPEEVSWSVKGASVEITPGADGRTCAVSAVAPGRSTITVKSGKKRATLKVWVVR